MEQIVTLFLLIILSWSYFQYKKEQGLMFYQKTDRDVSDGCMGKMVAVGVVLFLIITLIFQKELLEAVGKKFVE